MTKIDSLINEIQDGELSGPTKRQLKALTRITELFVAGSGRHSGQQLELFDEVFKALVAVIELKARAKLARHLATDGEAPAALVRAFAFDDKYRCGGSASQPIDRAQRDRSCAWRQHPEPGSSLRNRSAPNGQRINHRHPYRARRKQRGPRRCEECRCAYLGTWFSRPHPAGRQ